MTDKFGTSDDNTQDSNTDFGDKGTSDQGGTGNQGSNDDIEALRRRDAHAQTHIVTLERENSELRDKYAQLESKLASSATIEDVLSRLNKPDGQAVNADQLADAVEARLSAKEIKQRQDGNWAKVVDKVTTTFGEWKKADTEIQAKAKELGMSPEDATALARKSPEAFYELFLPKSGTANNSGATRVAGGQQATSAHTGEARNQEYYRKMRRENPNLYWKTETQAQLRRDLGFAN